MIVGAVVESCNKQTRQWRLQFQPCTKMIWKAFYFFMLRGPCILKITEGVPMELLAMTPMSDLKNAEIENEAKSFCETFMELFHLTAKTYCGSLLLTLQTNSKYLGNVFSTYLNLTDVRGEM